TPCRCRHNRGSVVSTWHGDGHWPSRAPEPNGTRRASNRAPGIPGKLHARPGPAADSSLRAPFRQVALATLWIVALATCGVQAVRHNCRSSGERIALLERPTMGRVSGFGELQRTVLQIEDHVMNNQNSRP